MDYKAEKTKKLNLSEIEFTGNSLEEKLKNKLNEKSLSDLKNVKLSDTLESFSKEISMNTENPVDRLSFSSVRKRKDIKIKNYSNLGLLLITVCLICLSIFFNSYFIEKIDPVLFKTFSSMSTAVNENAFEPGRLVSDLIMRPYVVTIGEFGNYSIAKDEAIRLLPTLKQIQIKELESGVLTFEIERLGSKKNAYSLANELIQRGFESVHVRYLPRK